MTHCLVRFIENCENKDSDLQTGLLMEYAAGEILLMPSNTLIIE